MVGKTYKNSLIVIYIVFFMWGLIFCLNDILLPYLKSLFTLTYFKASLIQFTFFGTYLIASIPAGKIVFKYGYKVGVVLGLLISSIGCFLFYPAAHFKIYEVFLVSLFVVSGGITLLQVAANPFVIILGNPANAAGRLNLAQAINKVGYSVAPYVGTYFLFRQTLSLSVDQAGAKDASLVQKPYLILACLLLLLSVLVSRSQFPVVAGETDAPFLKALSNVKKYPQLIWGAVGIFTYVGAEITTNAFFISLLSDAKGANLSQAVAAQFLADYWILATLTGFLGFIVLKYISPGRLIFVCGIITMLLLIICIYSSGNLLIVCLVLVGGFISIMFPTIFSIALEGLGDFTSHGSAILLTAVVGGALVPPIQGILADHIGIHSSFIVPCLCYAYITGFGYWAGRRSNYAIL